MKKLLTAAIVTVCLALTACGSSSAEDTSAASTAVSSGSDETKETSGGPKGRIAYIVGALGDKSFADSGEAGMDILRSEGWEVRTVETGDASDADRYEDYILDVLDQGYDYIVGYSTYMEIMADLAPEYPDVKFVGFDQNWTDDQLPDNMTSIFYAQNEGSYLVGMLAAAMTESGTVAVDVAMENPVINDFITGYVDGVNAWNEANGTEVKVLRSACGSYSDPATMKSLVLDQIRNNGADVFYQVAGGSGDGLFEACAETGDVWAIGVDSDQYAAYIDSENPEKADVILTSMLKEVGNSLVSIFHSIEEGDETMWGHTITLGLADSSVGYVDNDFFRTNVPEEIRTAIDDAAAKIAAKEIQVKSYYDFADEAEYMEFVDSAG